MEQVTKIKAILTVLFAIVSSVFGVLAIPVLLMIGCNVLDYVTGLIASPYRKEDINSYKSIRGIFKKISMWLLVIVGAIVDELILYAGSGIGIKMPFTFLVACIVALWIVCNELISILENFNDILGDKMPAFLLPLVKNIKKQVEDKVHIEDKAEGE